MRWLSFSLIFVRTAKDHGEHRHSQPWLGPPHNPGWVVSGLPSYTAAPVGAWIGKWAVWSPWASSHGPRVHSLAAPSASFFPLFFHVFLSFVLTFLWGGECNGQHWGYIGTHTDWEYQNPAVAFAGCSKVVLTPTMPSLPLSELILVLIMLM